LRRNSVAEDAVIGREGCPRFRGDKRNEGKSDWVDTLGESGIWFLGRNSPLILHNFVGNETWADGRRCAATW
jgi:hypothetical protein